VKPEDIQEGDEADPEQHPIAIALRRQRGIDDARVSKREVLIRRGEKWFRYGAPKRVLARRSHGETSKPSTPSKNRNA
jgi:hypothetical protein